MEAVNGLSLLISHHSNARAFGLSGESEAIKGLSLPISSHAKGIRLKWVRVEAVISSPVCCHVNARELSFCKLGEEHPETIDT